MAATPNDSPSPTPALSHRSPPPQPAGSKYRVLVSVVFGVFMVVLDSTVVNVAFQTLRHEYGASLSSAQWIISLYVLALGVATPVSGFLADRFGIKRTYISGLAGFVVGSFLCGIAPTLPLLVAARAVQGLAGGIALPLGTAQLLRAFPPNEQGKALGLFGLVLVFAPAIGPVLGGALVDAGLWRWIFFINVPIGVFGVILASRSLREYLSHREHRMDWPGLVTEAIGFGAILYGAALAESSGWNSPRTLLWLGIGAAGLASFAVVELFVAREPLLDLRLYAKRTFLIASLVGYVTVLALFGAEFMLPVYLQLLRGLSGLDAGLTLLPLAIAAGIATPTAGRLYDRIGARPLLFIGFTLLTFNTWQFAQLDAVTPIGWIRFLLVVRGIALGLTVQTTFVTALSVVPSAALARGTSLVNALRNVTQSLGVAILAAVLASTFSPASRAIQLAYQDSGDVAGICVAAGSDGGAAAAQAARPGSAGVQRVGEVVLTADTLQRACDEGIAGFERAYRLTFIASLIALGLGMLLPGWPGSWGGRVKHHVPEPEPEPA